MTDERADDHGAGREEAVDEAPARSSARTGRPGAPWALVAILTLIVGFAGGLLVGVILADDDSDEGADTGGAAAVDCETAQAGVQGAIDEMTALSDVEEQDATFFAAMIVQQRSITFLMETAPDCFSLQDRAAAEGLLAGFEGLIQRVEPGSVTFEASTESPPEPDADGQPDAPPSEPAEGE